MHILKIAGHEYKVCLKPTWDREAAGEVRRDIGEIWIDEELMESEKKATLWHEIIHVLNGELEEEQVDFIAQGINQVLKDNATILNEIFKEKDLGAGNL